MMARLLFVMLVAALGCKRDPSPRESPASISPTGSQSPSSADAAAPGAAWGDPCGACAAGLTCTPWTTESGEQRATCEIPCGPKPDYACPPNLGCIHQGGGPSAVCLGPNGEHKR